MGWCVVAFSTPYTGPFLHHDGVSLLPGNMTEERYPSIRTKDRF